MGRTGGMLAGGMLDGLVSVLFPPACPACGAETAAPGTLCAACWAGTDFVAGPVCTQCGRPEPGLPAPDPAYRCTDCLARQPRWSRARAVAFYGGAARRLVMSLKHGDRLDTVPMMAGWMARAGRELLAEADLVTPVPLHWRRRIARRFNQSAELARAIARLGGRAYAPDLMRRVRATPSMQGLDREARAANVRDAIRAAPGARGRVEGRTVLVIDDVMTSGATLDAAAGALLDAGAARVDALVMALVPAPPTTYVAPDTDEMDLFAESER